MDFTTEGAHSAAHENAQEKVIRQLAVIAVFGKSNNIEFEAISSSRVIDS
jgi:hypothetical protein